MDKAQTNKETEKSKEKYNFDDDTSSYSPVIEEESNNEEEEQSQSNPEKSPEKDNPNITSENSSHLIDKLISIQKQMDNSQNNSKYYSNFKENKDMNNNALNKSKKNYRNNINNFDDLNNKNYKKNKDILSLNESDDSDNDDDYNNNSAQYNNHQKNKNKKQKLNNQKEKEDYFSPNKSPKEDIKSQEDASVPKKEKGCELFIGNLNILTEKEDLNSLFSPFGEITDIRIHKNEENKKCYAFVRFASKESANSALKLDSTLLNNRHIKVTKSNENATIFIGNIRKTWTKEELETKIRRIFHNISKIDFFTDPGNPSKNRGFCFGIFNTRNEAIKALNYVNKKGGINIDGISITCDWADVVDDDDNSKSNQIFISNIKKEVNENELKKYFNKFEKVVNVIMSKNHLNSKRKDLAFITFESHESAVSAIKQFEEEKNDKNFEKNLKKIFFLNENENVNMIQVSLAFSQEAMQNKKKKKIKKVRI